MSGSKFGKRGRTENDAGIRKVAPTYGRMRIQTRNAKTQQSMTVDGHAERLTCCALNVDPSVETYLPQPLTVDLIDGCIHHTTDAVKEARRKHAGRPGPWFYTPDHLVHWSGQSSRTALEVKDESWPGDNDYERKLKHATEILNYFGYECRKVVIPSHPQVALRRNLALLSQAMVRNLPPIPVALQQAELVTDSEQVWTLSSACQALRTSIQQAPWLVLRGYIGMDVVGQHIKADTPVYLAGGDLEHLCLLRRMMQ
ncbi:hypothetical protein [Hydrogenophaga sp. OTU3427]|uniref:hypothetical protein n=1 Tax=Hydrogenophaga sp. OTU3427 TaxID=3043856 RepID=UPI00313F0B66